MVPGVGTITAIARWLLGASRGAVVYVPPSDAAITRWLAARGVCAFAIGRLVVYRERWLAAQPAVVAHEAVHVQQWERWGWLLPMLVLVAALRAGSARTHAFERAARGVQDAAR